MPRKLKGRLRLPNVKWELFAQLVGTYGKTQVDAYCQAVRKKETQPRQTSLKRASILACTPAVRCRILYLENRRIDRVLKAVDDSHPIVEECVQAARYGLRKSIAKGDMGMLNAHNRTLSELGGFFKIEINNRTVIIDERMDEYEYPDSGEAELLGDDDDS